MKRFLNWLETKFSRHSAAVEGDERHTPEGVRVRVRPKGIAEEEYSVEIGFDSDRTPTVPTLSILKESSYDVSESYEVIEAAVFDPYDTGGHYTSKSSSRK
jgi:hypothetical protein